MAQEDQYRRFEITQNALHAENDVFWTRFSGFATLQAGLLVIATVDRLQRYALAVIALGIILTLIWAAVTHLGVLYVDRRKADYHAERKNLFPRTETGLRKWFSATNLATLAPWLVIVVWGIVLVAFWPKP